MTNDTNEVRLTAADYDYADMLDNEEYGDAYAAHIEEEARQEAEHNEYLRATGQLYRPGIDGESII